MSDKGPYVYSKHYSDHLHRGQGKAEIYEASNDPIPKKNDTILDPFPIAAAVHYLREEDKLSNEELHIQ